MNRYIINEKIQYSKDISLFKLAYRINKIPIKISTVFSGNCLFNSMKYTKGKLERLLPQKKKKFWRSSGFTWKR